MFDPDDDGLPAESEPPTVLLDDIDDIRFIYYGREDERDLWLTWLSRWPAGDRLPQLVHPDVIFPDGDPRVWPELIAVPVMAAETGR